MSNAKRAIMVPVMTLAVCAIAMVGLGFALETSVTSDTNDVEVLMIDLAKELNGLGTNAPKNTTSDNALDLKIETNKNDTVQYTVTDGCAYLRIYGNLTSGVSLKASINDTSTESNKITEVGLTLYSVTNSGVGTAKATVTANSSGATFQSIPTEENEQASNASLGCGTYYVKVTSINGLSFTGTNYNDTTWTGTWNDQVDSTKVSISYTFTATTSSS